MRNVARRALILGCVGAGLATLPGVAAGKGARPGVCDAHRSGAKLVTRSLIVFGKHTGMQTSNGPETAYFACLRPRGARVRLGYDAPGDDIYGSDETTGAFRAAGTYVAALSSSGEASRTVCDKYQQPNCPQPRNWLRVADVRLRHSVAFDVRRGNVITLILSPAGAVAWLEYTGSSSYELRGTALRTTDPTRLTGAPALIDSGAIDRHSLRFDGLTLRWTRDGQMHTQALS